MFLDFLSLCILYKGFLLFIEIAETFTFFFSTICLGAFTLAFAKIFFVFISFFLFLFSLRLKSFSFLYFFTLFTFTIFLIVLFSLKFSFCFFFNLKLKLFLAFSPLKILKSNLFWILNLAQRIYRLSALKRLIVTKNVWDFLIDILSLVILDFYKY